MDDSLLKLAILIGGLLGFTLLGGVYIFVIQNKYLNQLRTKLCPSCNLELGAHLKMEPGFTNIEKRQQSKSPLKINLTGTWPVTCPHCGSKSIYNFNINDFGAW